VGQPRSLTHLAVVDGFERNHQGRRGMRIGIDASIWFFHATYGKEGENPELRTLFFRCARLLGTPFLPLFVFDGPRRPDIKRGKRINKEQHWMVNGMKNIIHAFGFASYTVRLPWHVHYYQDADQYTGTWRSRS
jgi:Holliday junction resolvase YEN1